MINKLLIDSSNNLAVKYVIIENGVKNVYIFLMAAFIIYLLAACYYGNTALSNILASLDSIPHSRICS